MQKLNKNRVSQNVIFMPLVNPNAAGIDVGDTLHAVAIPRGIAAKRVRTFGTMTCDLEAIVEWLSQTGIQTVGLESFVGGWFAVVQCDKLFISARTKVKAIYI